MKINADFHIDFYRDLSSFWLHLAPFEVSLAPFRSIWSFFGLPWGHLGGKMEAKEPAKMESCLPRGSGPHEDFILEVFRFDFRRILEYLGHPLGVIFLASFLLSLLGF